MIRDAVKQHTGQEPPESPAAPAIKAYGEVTLEQSVPLLDTLESLWPGDGISSRFPLPMEEYGQGYALTHGQDLCCWTYNCSTGVKIQRHVIALVLLHG